MKNYESSASGDSAERGGAGGWDVLRQMGNGGGGGGSWEDLVKMGKEGFQGRKLSGDKTEGQPDGGRLGGEVAGRPEGMTENLPEGIAGNLSESEFIRRREERLAELREKMQNLYRQSESEVNAEAPTRDGGVASSVEVNAGTDGAERTGLLGRFANYRENLKTNRLEKRAQKQAELTRGLMESGNEGSRERLLKMVETGKLDVENAVVADAYIRVKFDFNNEGNGEVSYQERPKTRMEKIEEMEKLGITPEQSAEVVLNQCVVEMQRMMNDESPTDEDFYKMELLGGRRSLDKVGLGEVFEIMDKYELNGLKEKLREGVDIQSFADKVLTERVVQQLQENVQHKALNGYVEKSKWYIEHLKELGWKPFERDVSALYAKGRDSGKLQETLAEQYGLIDGKTVDKMYHYSFENYDAALKRGDESLPELPVSQNLQVSGEDEFAKYWQEISRQSGRDEMVAMAEMTGGDASRRYRPGSMLDAAALRYAKNRDEGGESPLEFLVNRPQLWQGAEKGFAREVKKLLDRDTETWRGELEREVQSPNILYQKWLGQGGPGVMRYRDSVLEHVLESATNYNANGRKTFGEMFDEEGLTQDARELALVSPTWYDQDWDVAVRRLEGADYAKGFTREAVQMFERGELYNNGLGDLHRQLEQQPGLLEGFSPERRALLTLAIQQESRFLRDLLDSDDPKRFFDGEGRPLPALGERCFNGERVGRRVLFNLPEAAASLPQNQQHFLSVASKAADDSPLIEYGDREIDKYFDEQGAKPELWTDLYAQGDYEDIIGQGEDVINGMPLNDVQKKSLQVYQGISDSILRKSFTDFMQENYLDLSLERVETVADVLNRLGQSNASEVEAHAHAFAAQLLKSDLNDDAEMYNKLGRIEDVFVHNNLPYVGKAYLSFAILHPGERLKQDFDFSADVVLSDGGFASGSRVSPVLKAAVGAERTGVRAAETVIYTDMVKAAMGSNNRSVRDYLKSLRNGQELLDKLLAGEAEWEQYVGGQGVEAAAEQESGEGRGLNGGVERGREDLRQFAAHLNTLYNNTVVGREHPRQLTGDLRRDLTELTGAFAPTERHKLADRVVRSFGYFAGAESLDEAERLMDGAVAMADERNRRAAREGIKLQKGDFIKGIGNTTYLGSILQNGSVAKEFLGDSATSDATPLDTDLSLILEEPQSLNEGMKKTIANTYGPVWVGLKGDGNRSGVPARFEVTRRSPAEEEQAVTDAKVVNRDKLEAFYTGVLGADHYGVRTGFASSEIDFLVTDQVGTGDGGFRVARDGDGTPYAATAGFEIARNGFYIPVVNRQTGDLAFTPEDYDGLRRKMSGLSYYEAGDYQVAAPDKLDCAGTVVNGQEIPSVAELVGQLAENEREVNEKHAAINRTIDAALAEFGESQGQILTRKDVVDGDLTEGTVEVIDTGSTGRYDNAPGDGDFDYMFKVDKSLLLDGEKMTVLRDALLKHFGKTDALGAGEVLGYNLRLKGVEIEGLAEPVDVDVTFEQKTNKVQYSTDMALRDYLEGVRRAAPEQYQQVVANIIYAKKFLKAAGAYKNQRSDSSQGGLGGVGVENWILQNGGSFRAAAEEFMRVAEQCKDFNEFKEKYQIWDFGENHAGGGRVGMHDNFVANNMNEGGYGRMREALRGVVG